MGCYKGKFLEAFYFGMTNVNTPPPPPQRKKQLYVDLKPRRNVTNITKHGVRVDHKDSSTTQCISIIIKKILNIAHSTTCHIYLVYIFFLVEGSRQKHGRHHGSFLREDDQVVSYSHGSSAVEKKFTIQWGPYFSYNSPTFVAQKE